MNIRKPAFKVRMSALFAFIVLALAVIGYVTASDEGYADGAGDGSAYVLSITDGVEGSFVITGVNLPGTTVGNTTSYTYIDGKVVTLTYVPGDNGTFIMSWDVPDSGITVLKKTAYTIQFTMSDDVSITPKAPSTVVTVHDWAEFKNAVAGDSDCIVVDTGGELKPMSETVGNNVVCTQLVINRSLTIVGNNPDGKNGFCRVQTITEAADTKTGILKPNITIDGETKSDSRDLPSILISSGTVSISGVTFDGGAVWTSCPSEYLNSLDNNGTKLISEAEEVLGRGVYNSGVRSQNPFIENYGTLYLLDEVSIQNAFNGWMEPNVDTNGCYGKPGGGLFNQGTVYLDGVVFKDCYAVRGAAVYHNTSDELNLAGNTLITHNGGLNCQLGAAIYSNASGITISGAKINNNYGSFIITTRSNMTITAGEINGNTMAPPIDDYSGKQGYYSGVVYVFQGSTFTMRGGYMTGNQTINVNGNGYYSGIVFQEQSNSFVMSAGTICDNVVLNGSVETHCDIVFGAKTVSTCHLRITGGSIGYIYNSGNVILLDVDRDSTENFVSSTLTVTVTFKAGDNDKLLYKVPMVPVHVYESESSESSLSGYGYKIDHVKNGSGTQIVYGFTDVVTDSSGCIYIYGEDVNTWKAYQQALIVLTGKPVINGTVAEGNQLTVLYGIPEVRYQWYAKGDSGDYQPVSTDVSYRVQSGMQYVYVVLTGTNGYTGTVTSDSVSSLSKVSFMVADSVKIYDGSSEIEHFGFFNGSYRLPERVEGLTNQVFVGWYVLVGSSMQIYASGATVSSTGDITVTPILLPSSQYHATITIGTVATTNSQE